MRRAGKGWGLSGSLWFSLFIRLIPRYTRKLVGARSTRRNGVAEQQEICVRVRHCPKKLRIATLTIRRLFLPLAYQTGCHLRHLSPPLPSPARPPLPRSSRAPKTIKFRINDIVFLTPFHASTQTPRREVDEEQIKRRIPIENSMLRM